MSESNCGASDKDGLLQETCALELRIPYMKLKGSKNFRFRLLLSTLSSTPILNEDIRSESTWPGLCPHEVSFLRLLEKISDNCSIEINETGMQHINKLQEAY